MLVGWLVVLVGCLVVSVGWLVVLAGDVGLVGWLGRLVVDWMCVSAWLAGVLAGLVVRWLFG